MALLSLGNGPSLCINRVHRCLYGSYLDSLARFALVLLRFRTDQPNDKRKKEEPPKLDSNGNG